MAIEGPLKELGIHDVFQLLDLSQKTGVLSVTSKLRHNQGTVYFDHGAIVYAVIQSNPHPLGELLRKAGKISDADLSRARDMQDGGDARRLGEILVAIGAITQRELERQVRFQVEEVIFEVMNWREGYFSFEEGLPHEIPAEASVRIPTEALLMEGARRIDEWSRIQHKVPHLGVVPRIVGGGDEGHPGQLDLLPTEWEVLAAIDGEHDLRTIAKDLGRSEFEVAKTVFGLESATLVSIADPKRSSRRAGPPGAEDLEALLERSGEMLAAGDLDMARDWAESARSLHPHEPNVYLTLGQIELTAGQPARAEDHLRRALRLDTTLLTAHRLLGDALARQGRFTEAVEWWERWLRAGEHDESEAAEVSRVETAMAAARTLGATLGVSGG